jgi:hypothetical protein
MSIREAKATNTDPDGPVPPADNIGRVVLNEAKSTIALSAFAAFLLSAATLVSMLYWLEYFETGNLPPVPNDVLAVILKCGAVAVLALPSRFAELLSPPRVIINYAGVSLRRRGITQTIGWGDLNEVSLQLRTIRDRYGGVTNRTRCLVIGGGGGGGERLILEPIFGVSPAALASYIQTRGQTSAGTTIALTQTPTPVMPPHVRVQLLVLGILGGLALAMVALACNVLRHAH